MSINFKYTIISVDEQARCMEVLYEAEGFPSQHIGARLPYEGETLDALVRMYAPIPYWLDLVRPVIVPATGISGVVPAADEEAAAIAALQTVAEAQPQPASEGAQTL